MKQVNLSLFVLSLTLHCVDSHRQKTFTATAKVSTGTTSPAALFQAGNSARRFRNSRHYENAYSIGNLTFGENMVLQGWGKQVSVSVLWHCQQVFSSISCK